ncbi:MAG: tRNA (N6-isopentenyl adenosine(37)-C2)-methylthiotransferase MiaB [Tissierellia bacterium]|nr:tRNA (N6-isopentenyl adenosine(37)-C2)-methylthiotransferase MiaB [Tissierellia bacterium]MDD3226860.1 tRNA (N6-isopentenyl adenosine(37)-C2)-methylthiotransferase MiaB [Tissierellia bacterium]MDD4046453.1 tRNA (N6-isopentenyl adenosine(37)-C2)-methylthiotransferase MiaB [Tissierellia bacterium]
MSKRKTDIITEDVRLDNDKIIELKNNNEQFFIINGRRKTYHILTYGCQMNEHDSEKISGMLTSIGYEETTDDKSADLVIFNTCLIRENAELRVFGKLGEVKGLKRKNPDMLVAVCGCMMQRQETREKVLKKFSFVDIIFGTNTIHELPMLIYNVEINKRKSVEIVDNTESIYENMPKQRKFKHKALVNITYGCNNFCTYCVVPYVRGREKSREPNEIIQEIKALSEDGCKEVTLLGQNVNSYGSNLEKKVTFAELLYEINKIEGIERIRFMTSHPKDLTDDLIKAIKECDKVCKHVHLPVQAGSNNILSRMNRKYTKEHYLNLVEKLKKAVPDIAITTDIIVGFPGETEEDFLETIDIVKKVQYDSAFTFLYSVREGTEAAKMENQVPDEVKHERFDKLLDVLYPIVLERNQQCIGKVFPVLVESAENDKLTGRTEHFRLVHFKGSNALIGEIVNVRITNVKTFHMEGEFVSLL